LACGTTSEPDFTAGIGRSVPTEILMIQGKTLKLKALGDGLFELCFDRIGDAVNKFDRLAIDALRQAVKALLQDGQVRGLLLTSARDSFIVGADIFEFGSLFGCSEAEIETQVRTQPHVVPKPL
jgi:3-hydroxyacyl-CoA dehydrogenase/enoyl-CoA hydratase/3-hydroxybutyryl-CoA epimerase/enoyl-CoA isomerase